MELNLSYDSAIEAWTLTHKQVQLTSPDTVAEWRRLLAIELEKVRAPVYLLVDIRNFEVSAAHMDDYGQTVKSIAHNFIAVMRYGATERTQTTVLLQAVLNRYQPNLYPDRESAVRALHQLRAKKRASADRHRTH